MDLPDPSLQVQRVQARVLLLQRDYKQLLQVGCQKYVLGSELNGLHTILLIKW